MEVDLVAYANLAKAILNENTPYSFDKAIIRSLFTAPAILPQKQLVPLRLTVIDGYYSTNMTKRYYGIEDITNALFEVGPSDSSLSQFFFDYISQPIAGSAGSAILNGLYGINKGGTERKRAQSLISKYAYFLTGFGFPIYDSLAKDSYVELSNRYPNVVPKCRDINDVDDFFSSVVLLNKGFADFDLLDNLLWLFGKVRKGSLSLVLNRARYEALLKACGGKIDYETIVAQCTNKYGDDSALGSGLKRFVGFVSGIV